MQNEQIWILFELKMNILFVFAFFDAFLDRPRLEKRDFVESEIDVEIFLGHANERRTSNKQNSLTQSCLSVCVSEWVTQPTTEFRPEENGFQQAYSDCAEKLGNGHKTSNGGQIHE